MLNILAEAVCKTWVHTQNMSQHKVQWVKDKDANLMKSAGLFPQWYIHMEYIEWWSLSFKKNIIDKKVIKCM